MPRKVDVEQQKSDIAEAVWRLVGRAGLEAVSLREVATEAGVSMGRVQHYFRTKEAMLLYGLRLAQRRMHERIEARLVRRPDPDAEDVLRAVLEEMLGGDHDTRQTIRICVAFLPRALDDQQVADLLYADDAEIRAHAARVIGQAQAQGRADPGLDPEREARILWSLAGSLGVEVAFGRTSVEEARATLSYHLDRLLGSSARRPERADRT
ncbi:transcriptional regulator, TetR family [Streptoalloteichus tenebrarius]|uniref:Transcriptional regulator, TetR family n=1 Tax=Streptoalloteichus tenebrarius (strain ATCC 17920 / DSM 40477 / JCM 4838 / CBS 697.72 / NBRC 16177 / NCIMB 11028 / NRRL B-12390 / A12253. 1 / ISP 5477) TaxID=1933 RepID=A0ABT1HQ32_STRSD|nr:TetR/AcrR family transcriptional regulator [Streptoalloteichus tenebrarius]MCP2257622.1 transcriptional regulator, TetR family [Streptoalloteichus tenebrarius]BFE98581.1 TetR/AcrR family transcriptional regulator [Streptoalloteichus tenebrarius]